MIGQSSDRRQLSAYVGIRRKERGKPVFLDVTADNLFGLMEILNRLSDHYDIRLPSLHVLLFVYRSWVIEHRGVTVYGMCMGVMKSDSGSSYAGMQQKRDQLVRAGLLQLGGFTKKRNRLYIPTVKAVEDLNYITELLGTVDK